MSTEIVTIITPSYNGASFIRSAYQTLVAQTYPNWEWNIVDDCSTDATADILKELSNKDPRVKPIRLTENKGAASARNAGLDAATGTFIAFLDVDDLWFPHKLQETISFMERTQTNFAYTNYSKVKNGVVGTTMISTPSTLTYQDLLKTCDICTSTVVIRRETIGGIRMIESLRKGQDYMFWLQVLSGKIEARRCGNDSLTLYTIGHNSLSSNKLQKAKIQWKIYREYLNLNIFAASYYFVSYAAHGLFKYYKF